MDTFHCEEPRVVLLKYTEGPVSNDSFDRNVRIADAWLGPSISFLKAHSRTGDCEQGRKNGRMLFPFLGFYGGTDFLAFGVTPEDSQWLYRTRWGVQDYRKAQVGVQP